MCLLVCSIFVTLHSTDSKLNSSVQGSESAGLLDTTPSTDADEAPKRMRTEDSSYQLDDDAEHDEVGPLAHPTLSWQSLTGLYS